MQAATALVEIGGIKAGRNRQHRNRIGIGLAKRGKRIGHAGAGDDIDDAGLAGRTGIAIGHEAGAPLVAGKDMGDARFDYAAIQFDIMHAGNAENDLDATRGKRAGNFNTQGLHQRLQKTKVNRT